MAGLGGQCITEQTEQAEGQALAQNQLGQGTPDARSINPGGARCACQPGPRPGGEAECANCPTRGQHRVTLQDRFRRKGEDRNLERDGPLSAPSQTIAKERT